MSNIYETPCCQKAVTHTSVAEGTQMRCNYDACSVVVMPTEQQLYGRIVSVHRWINPIARGKLKLWHNSRRLSPSVNGSDSSVILSQKVRISVWMQAITSDIDGNLMRACRCSYVTYPTKFVAESANSLCTEASPPEWRAKTSEQDAASFQCNANVCRVLWHLSSRRASSACSVCHAAKYNDLHVTHCYETRSSNCQLLRCRPGDK